MKWFLAVLVSIVLLMNGLAYAGAGGTVVKIDDSEGAKIVWTQYSVDGVIVPSSYPAPNTAGRVSCPSEYWNGQCLVWVSGKYTFQNFDGLDAKGIEDRILQDVSAYSKNLITKKFTGIENSKLDLSGVVGKSVVEESADIQLSPTKALTVTTQGTAVEKTLTPISIKPLAE